MASAATTTQGTNNVSLFFRRPDRININSDFREGISCLVESSFNYVRHLLYIRVPSALLTFMKSVSLSIYVSCATEFFWRFFNDKPIRQASSSQPKITLSPLVKMMIAGLTFSTICLFIRYLYPCFREVTLCSQINVV